jgi:hypothetical protein
MILLLFFLSLQLNATSEYSRQQPCPSYGSGMFGEEGTATLISCLGAAVFFLSRDPCLIYAEPFRTNKAKETLNKRQPNTVMVKTVGFPKSLKSIL